MNERDGKEEEEDDLEKEEETCLTNLKPKGDPAL
jgi:hypothetical protein